MIKSSIHSILNFKFVATLFPLIYASLFAGLSIPAHGQTALEGKVIDQNQHLPSVTLLLFTQDSVMFDGTVTDSAGHYIFKKVPAGNYFISASMIGYATRVTDILEAAGEKIKLPDIILEEIATTLNELQVTSEKSLFDQRPEKLVINLGGSITSSGNTALDVLQKSPGIVVNKTNNSITMLGKTGVRIMINEKILHVSVDVALQMLDGMTASNIERIELITAPGANYDAEGNAGIIHIVTKQRAEYGTNGSLGLTVGYRWAESLGGNMNVNHRTARFAGWADYSIVRNHNLHLLDITRQSSDFSQAATVHGHRENVTTQQNLSAGFEWKVNEKTSVMLGVTGYKRNWNMQALNHDSNYVARDSALITRMNIRQSNIWQSGTVGIGVHTKINPKSDLSFSVDYLYYHNNNPSEYNNVTSYNTDITEESKIDLRKKTPIRFLVAKVDYQYTVSPSLYLEVGLKMSTSDFNNSVVVQRFTNNRWEIDPDFTTQGTLSEQVKAIYFSSRWKPGTRWEINSGLRYEHTQFSSYAADAGPARIRRKYGYLFPSLLLKKQLKAEHDMVLSYTRRISRPTYNDIASYAAFWSPTTFTAANTSLWPAISDAVSVSYHQPHWTVSLQYIHIQNEIVSLQPAVDVSSNTLIYRSQNLEYLNTIGVSTSYGLNIKPWWEVQSNLTLQHHVARTSHLAYNVTISRYGVNVNLVNLFKLPNSFAIEVSGMYQSKSISGIVQYLRFGSLNVGIQKSFGTNGTIRLAADDILYTNNWRIKAYSPENNLDVFFAYDWHNQFVRVSYTRSLGNTKLKSVKVKSGSEEERKRIGN